MDNDQKFSLEDIMKEFGDPAEDAEFTDEADFSEEADAAEMIAEEAASPEEAPVSGDTIRLDSLHIEGRNVRDAVQIDDETEEEEEVPVPGQSDEAFSDGWEPEYEQPMGEYVPPRPILFYPPSRLHELKRKLVAGPEKLYYSLTEKGCAKLQAAIFFCFLTVLAAACSTVLYAFGMVQESRLKLMIFVQFLTMLLAALFGSNQLIEGACDLFKKRFSLNSLLGLTFLFCLADGILCLRQVRIPCCAAFSLSMLMSLWSTYERRVTRIEQTDTMRKANHLDGVTVCADYSDGRLGLLRGEGEVEDFMDTLEHRSKSEKVLCTYALIAALVSIAIGVTAGVLHGISVGVQTCAVCLLAAVPASAFIVASRPMRILERRLHSLGTVLCGWQSVEKLSRKAVFPLDYNDLFPAGSVKMNGVKFYGSRQPDEIIAYCTAVIEAHGSGLAPLFTQVLESRNGRHYDALNLQIFEDGGIGGEVLCDPVLIGSLSFLQEMGVAVPDGIRVGDTVCVAISGEFCGVFAISYTASRGSNAGLNTLCSYRGLSPAIVCEDFVLTKAFLQDKFTFSSKRLWFPDAEKRDAMLAKSPDEDARALLLVTTQGLAPFAYGVTGARALHTANRLGTAVHMAGGILGLLIMLALTILGAQHLLTPANMFLYQLVWLIPGLLITEWTRSV